MADSDFSSPTRRAYHRYDHRTDSDWFPGSHSLVPKRSPLPQLYGTGFRQRD